MNAAFLLNAGLRKQFDEALARRDEDADLGAAPIAAMQLRALQRSWADAVSDLPYYGRLVSSGHAPAEIESWDDLSALPVLTRRHLQDQPELFIRRSGPPASFMTTAGSTGTPLRIGMNQAERDLMRVVKLSAWQAYGYDRSSRLFLIWGHAHLLGTGWKGRVNHLKRRLADAAASELLGHRGGEGGVAVAYVHDETGCASPTAAAHPRITVVQSSRRAASASSSISTPRPGRSSRRSSSPAGTATRGKHRPKNPRTTR
jgi:hypothetical protein